MNEHPEEHEASRALPGLNQDVILVCQGFRCLGFLAGDGKWRDVHSRNELPMVMGWRHIGDDDHVPTHWLKAGNV